MLRGGEFERAEGNLQRGVLAIFKAVLLGRLKRP